MVSGRGLGLFSGYRARKKRFIICCFAGRGMHSVDATIRTHSDMHSVDRTLKYYHLLNFT